MNIYDLCTFLSICIKYCKKAKWNLFCFTVNYHPLTQLCFTANAVTALFTHLLQSSFSIHFNSSHCGFHSLCFLNLLTKITKDFPQAPTTTLFPLPLKIHPSLSAMSMKEAIAGCDTTELCPRREGEDHERRKRTLLTLLCSSPQASARVAASQGQLALGSGRWLPGMSPHHEWTPGNPRVWHFLCLHIPPGQHTTTPSCSASEVLCPDSSERFFCH